MARKSNKEEEVQEVVSPSENEEVQEAPPVEKGLRTIAEVSEEEVLEYQRKGVLVGSDPKKKSAIIKVGMVALLALFLSVGSSFAAIAMTDEAVLGNSRWSVDSSGDLEPGADSTYDIGSSGNEVALIYVDTATVGTAAIGTANVSSSLVVPAETVAATNVITAAECGSTFFLAHATEFASTLPALSTVSEGCGFTFIVKAAPASASYTVLTGNSLEDKLIGGINELEVDTGDDGPYIANGDTITFVDGVAVVGDYVTVMSDGTSWYLHGQANADGGITVTKAD